jgi:hypothetical protein
MDHHIHHDRLEHLAGPKQNGIWQFSYATDRNGNKWLGYNITMG